MLDLECPGFPCALSKALRTEKLAAHLFEVDEDVEKDEVGPGDASVACRYAKMKYYFSD